MKTPLSFVCSIILLGILLSGGLAATLAHADINESSAQTQKVDQLVDALLAKQEIAPHEPIDDELFVRRIYLAVVGRIPTAAEAQSFLDCSDGNKRDRLIDQLLETVAHKNA